MSEATGVDFTEIMRAGTYDAKVNKNINLSGAGINVNTKVAPNIAKENVSAEEQK